MLPFMAAMMLAGVVMLFARRLDGPTVELKDDGILQRTGGGGSGGSAFCSAYADIESCTAHRDRYQGTEFSVLRLKNRYKLVIVVEPVKLIVVPHDISLDSVLKILRDHGVQVFEK